MYLQSLMLEAASIFEILFEKYCLNLVVESLIIFKTHSESLQIKTLLNLPTEASTKSFNSIAFAAADNSRRGMEL